MLRERALWPSSLPEAHARFLEGALRELAKDPRIVGVAAGGSFASDTMDGFSDLDLVVAAEPSAYQELLAGRRGVAEALGALLAAFTGEHVSEPRLLVCLYAGEPPLHVDLKFVALADVATRVEDPVVLWERDGRLARALAEGIARYPEPDRQWLEDRFWVWVHYVAAKIGRGELFEAHGALGQIRGMVLGPLALARAGARPSGVRNLERFLAADLELLRPTAAGLTRDECISALYATVSAYRSLRSDEASLLRREAAELAAVAYLEQVRTSTILSQERRSSPT